MLYTFPPSTVHASLPFLPVYLRSSDGGTFKYGVPAGRPRRSAPGDEDRWAQSSGEWPGVSRTLRRGLVGMEEWVGGGAREEAVDGAGRRLGRGERKGGGMRLDGTVERRGGPRTPPDARWAELGPGKDGAGGELSRLRLGTWGEMVVAVMARGDVGEEGSLLKGGGGGGMAFRSSSSFVL